MFSPPRSRVGSAAAERTFSPQEAALMRMSSSDYEEALNIVEARHAAAASAATASAATASAIDSAARNAQIEKEDVSYGPDDKHEVYIFDASDEPQCSRP